MSVAVALRVVHRGSFIPGWDVVGAANGLRLISTLSARELLQYYRQFHFDPSLGWNVFSIPLALLPGALASMWPWEYWPHVVTAGMVAIIIMLLAGAIHLQWPDCGVLLLAWAASPTLLSYSVAGFPYISNALPFALAIFTVLRWRTSLLVTVALAAVSIGVAWHVQELGRTVFAVFLAAVLFVPGARWYTRATWLVAGAVELWLSTRYHSSNTGHYATMSIPAVSVVPGHLVAFARHFLLEWNPDFPFLLVAGLIACIGATLRWFWLTLIGFQLALLFLLSANAGTLQGIVAVWPRRTLLLSVLCAAACGTVYREGRRTRTLVLGLLAVGSVVQLGQTMWWASTPWDREGQGWAFTLPYTHTPIDAQRNLDSMVHFFLPDWAAEMRSRVERGRKIVLIYNLTSYDENATDPAGVIDRLYLRLGHERFARSMFVFGNDRRNELPIRPLADVGRALADLKPEADNVDVYLLHHPFDDRMSWVGAQKHAEETRALVDALVRQFEMTAAETRRDSEGRTLTRFALRPRS